MSLFFFLSFFPFIYMFICLQMFTFIKVIRNSTFHLYADDLQIYIHFLLSDLLATITNMNTDIEAITTWAYKHGLKLNETKTQAMLLGTSRLLNKLDLNSAPKLRLNGTQLEYSDSSVRNLGLTLSRTL